MLDMALEHSWFELEENLWNLIHASNSHPSPPAHKSANLDLLNTEW